MIVLIALFAYLKLIAFYFAVISLIYCVIVSLKGGDFITSLIYIFKRFDLKRFEFLKKYLTDFFICYLKYFLINDYRPQFSDFLSKISALLLSTDSH